MKRIIAAALGAGLALTGAAWAQQSVPIPTDGSAPPAATPDLSKINPTAGPAAPKKVAKARKPAKPGAAKPASARASQDRGEVQALNWLEANGYRDFSNLHRVGRSYQATIADPAGPYTVTVDPRNGRSSPPSAAADRETRALNLINDRGFGSVSAIRPAVGGGYIAKVAPGGQAFEVFADPDRGTVARIN